MYPCPRSTKRIKKILCAQIFNFYVYVVHMFVCSYVCGDQGTSSVVIPQMLSNGLEITK